MIRYLSNKLTDSLGRSNFVDSNGMCVGLKEYPDGNPIQWTTTPYSEGDTFVPPLTAFTNDREFLRKFLDSSPYVFGYMCVDKHPEDENVEIAHINLISEVANSVDLRLWIIISKADNVYFTDLSMGMKDKKKLFGNVDSLKAAVDKIRRDLGSILKDLNAVDEIIRNMKDE